MGYIGEEFSTYPAFVRCLDRATVQQCLVYDSSGSERTPTIGKVFVINS